MLYTVLLNFVATNRTTTNSSYVYFPQKKKTESETVKKLPHIYVSM